MTGVEALRTLGPPPRVFVAATGAGAGVQAALWAVPGSSAFLVGAELPYATHEVDRFLGFRPARYCDEETALELAIAAYLRAREAAVVEAAGGVPAAWALGVGLTASVASLVAHRGDHRVFVATVGARGAAIWSARLTKGVGDAARARDGLTADRLGLAAMLAAAGVAGAAFGAGGAGIDGEIARREVSEAEVRTALFRHPLFAPGGLREASAGEDLRSVALLPGSFDPLHRGHRMIAEAVERDSGRRVVYALTADPPHKPGLRGVDLLDRVASVRSQRGQPRALLLTQRDALFIDKARQFPGAGIALGVDAVARLLDPSWGPGINEILEDFGKLGTRFFVVGRLLGGRWTTLDDLAIPGRFRDLFQSVAGREDVSSSELRASLATGTNG